MGSANASKKRSGVPTTVASKKRGRPSGSKNKPKQAIDIMPTPSSGQAFAPWAHVVQVNAGDDVARAVATSACRLGGYISVISAAGPVFPPVFRQPFPYSPVELNSKGYFFLISIMPDGNGGMSVILAGPQRGMVLKGTFTGPLVALGTVVVVVSAAPKPEFSRLPPNNSTTCTVPLAIRGADRSAGENGDEQRPHFPSMEAGGVHLDCCSGKGLPQLISPAMEQRCKEMSETLGRGLGILPTSFNGASSSSSGGWPSELIISSDVPEPNQLQASKEDGARSAPSATGDGAEEQQWRLIRQENQECTEILSSYLMEDDHQEECELVSRGGEEDDGSDDDDGGWNKFLFEPTFWSKH